MEPEELTDSVPTSVPKTAIHVVVGRDEFTDDDIREWAKGNVQNIAWVTLRGALLIIRLSQIIVGYILEKVPQ